MKLFPRMELAVKAMALCCDSDDKSPMARSEVYNETWLLRMVLAKLHDSEIVCNDDCAEILQDISKAVRIEWISEGGLRPTLDKEGTTWTDAILGNVTLRDSEEAEKDSGSKRGVEIKQRKEDAGGEDVEDVGVIVIEAKVGSRLASRTSNYPGYNQAARNIACLARLVMESKIENAISFADKCRFIVICPKPEDREGASDKIDKSLEKSLEKNWKEANDILARARETVYKTIKESEGKGNLFNNEEQLKTFETIVEKIAQRSVVISWETIIKVLQADDVDKFYQKVLEVSGRSKR